MMMTYWLVIRQTFDLVTTSQKILNGKNNSILLRQYFKIKLSINKNKS
jgi:hypothetical protein